MEADIRHDPKFAEAKAIYAALRQPGSGVISDAAEAAPSPDGTQAVFTATIVDTLEKPWTTRIAIADLASGETEILTAGPNSDRLPKFAPGGDHIAFLSDRDKTGDFQLYLIDVATRTLHAAPRVDGWIETILWSPDGSKILLGVAGHGADVSGGQGAITSKQADAPEDWMPKIDCGDEGFRWRSAWIYDPADDSVRQVATAGLNVWELCWAGPAALAAVTTPAPSEGDWYRARLVRIDLQSGAATELFAPRAQIGWPAANETGDRVAIVEAVCSDRYFVAGDLRIVGPDAVTPVDTSGINVSYTQWVSDDRLMIGGHRGFESVVALVDARSGDVTELWSSPEITTSGFFLTLSALGADGDFLLVGESFLERPKLAIVEQGQYRTVRAFAADLDALAGVGIERRRWSAPDGLDIEGYLLRPDVPAPLPLVMLVHGGPVGHWRPMWLGRRNIHILMLLMRGYAVFMPNPRGSAGRGQDFAARVVGDMGGADTYDYLSGLDALVDEGIADPLRIGVTGASYGGFMSAWLITQDSRFAAAIPVAPVINQVTEHLLANIPQFVAMFLDDRIDNPAGRYFSRSPVFFAHQVRTPTLNICGALDRCTPPEEAAQFHAALLEHGVTSALAVYPQEGHGVRQLPAAIDFAARTVGWIETHMPAKTG